MLIVAVHVTSSPQDSPPLRKPGRAITNRSSVKLFWSVASFEPAGKHEKVRG
jgi:hypothetical protein